jgi:hypothetical protein
MFYMLLKVFDGISIGFTVSPFFTQENMSEKCTESLENFFFSQKRICDIFMVFRKNKTSFTISHFLCFYIFTFHAGNFHINLVFVFHITLEK